MDVKTGRMTAVYAAGHFLVDLACACVMFRVARGSGAWREAALLYNLLAFGGQMPLGLAADRFGNGRLFAAGGCVLAAAAFLPGFGPAAVSAAAGLGNALFHVGGGYDVLSASEGKAGLLGTFVSPGAIGLFLGAVLGRGAAPVWPVPLLLAAAGAAVLLLCAPRAPRAVSLDLPRAGLAALAALFLVVAVRSWTGFLFAFPWKSGLWAWAFVLCVALGKAAGGLLSDRIGPRLAAAVSLGPAAALFLFSGEPVCGCFAVLLFNMTMPVTLRAAADLLPGARGFSFGLLTFALFLGFLPAWLGLETESAGWMYAAVSLASLALLLPAVRRRER